MANGLLENNVSKNEILENISDIFRRYGIRSSSMDDISRYLKISKKTLYTMFENKNDVVQQVIQHWKAARNMYFEYLDFSTVEPIPYLFRLMNEAMDKFAAKAIPNNIFDVKKYYPQIYRTNFQEADPKVIQTMRNFFEKGIADGIFRKEINKDLQAYLVSMQFLSLTDPDMGCGSAFSMEDLITAIVENFIRSIATPKGIIQLENLIKNKYETT